MLCWGIKRPTKIFRGPIESSPTRCPAAMLNIFQTTVALVKPNNNKTCSVKIL